MSERIQLTDVTTEDQAAMLRSLLPQLRELLCEAAQQLPITENLDRLLEIEFINQQDSARAARILAARIGETFTTNAIMSRASYRKIAHQLIKNVGALAPFQEAASIHLVEVSKKLQGDAQFETQTALLEHDPEVFGQLRRETHEHATKAVGAEHPVLPGDDPDWKRVR